MGTAGGENRFMHAQGSQGGEEEPEVSAWARDTETTSPGHQGFSLRGDVSTCWCVSGVTSESRSGFTQSPERGGVAGSYVLFPGLLDVAWPCPDTWPLRPLLLMVSGPGGGCGEAHVCVNLPFGAQLMGRK